MKKEYEMPEADIVKFSMDTDIMNDSGNNLDNIKYDDVANLGQN